MPCHGILNFFFVCCVLNIHSSYNIFKMYFTSNIMSLNVCVLHIPRTRNKLHAYILRVNLEVSMFSRNMGSFYIVVVWLIFIMFSYSSVSLVVLQKLEENSLGNCAKLISNVTQEFSAITIIV